MPIRRYLDYQGKLFGVRVNANPGTVQIIHKSGKFWKLYHDGYARTYPRREEIESFISPRVDQLSAWHIAWYDLYENNRQGYEELLTKVWSPR